MTARRPRVVQLTGSSAGGVGRHAREIAAGLAPWYDVVLAGPADVVDAFDGPTRLVEIGDRPQLRDLTAIRELRTLARGSDVVHAHGLRAGGLAVLALRGLPRARRPRLVVTLHNLPVGSTRVRLVSAVLERLVARGADAVLGVSGDLVERARERGARLTDRALVPAPPRGHPRPIDRAALGVAPGDGLLVTVARLAPQKGLDVLADAAALLARDGVAVRWLVAGHGPLLTELTRRVQTEALPLGLLGYREDALDLLAGADVVVSTARWEGQPLWLQEALAVGAPIVATDVGGTGEVTAGAAVLVPDGDASAIANAVAALLADPERRSRMHAAARERADHLPRLADVAAQLRRIYGLLLG
ncbi:glycosyl transferase group 1 [Beutenbergia cavernae DSM 12333]|uniref:D-inositol 3-phosphate glycosyltransferase n=1 Tax=Beutenbergia cavernae (strain ATCC BAA-8 / DSM 12333 / CCUG 43141 / JCM 11478 / NBRC 16432 / NCIMB 13614 / HKI 0122) TaxID=471853 RepID=C5BVZ9_BEUC1|nr:glycosyltransferase family 4 protein [Beutenbergia cavernae]ACQ80600.1 glycosyl transferase group 1 [Beutenbergia cavernae DSM 12333]